MAKVNSNTPRHQRPINLKRFLFGAPYYPEHWSEKDRTEDAKRMADAGVNIVRMAEFAWDVMEPRRGAYTFSLFDETIDILGRYDIDTMLCTPTATPPRWLTVENPEWMRVNAQGQCMQHGSRQHCCTNNKSFRAASKEITAAMAEHFVGNDRVIGWQTDNELYCHMQECYCDSCMAKFRNWLTGRYGNIGTLNAAWGTSFWAQTYDDFSQILLPVGKGPAETNPTHQLDHFRFLSDSMIEFQKTQVDVLRQKRPSWWITHNGLFNRIDYWKFTEDLDFLSVDIYPGFAGEQPDNFDWASRKCEQCRAASGGFIIPEQQTAAGGNTRYLLENPQPGVMRLWSYQSVAHGADGVLHFRWRTCRHGTETCWNGVLQHDNVPRRTYDEFRQEGEEFRRIGPKLLGTTELVKAAVLIDQDQTDAYESMSMGMPGPGDQAKIAYGELLRRHIPCGLVAAADDLEGLDLVIVPSFAVIDEPLAVKLNQFVRDGGTIVATALTATRNRNNHALEATPPGPLAEVFGSEIVEYGKLAHSSLSMDAQGAAIPAGNAYEVLSLISASPLGTWTAPQSGAPHAATDQPALSINSFSKGKAIYLGTYFDEQNVKALFDIILAQTNIPALGSADECVEITCRQDSAHAYTFVLNHYGEEKNVTGLAKGIDILTGKKCDGNLTLPPYGVAVVEVA